MPEDPKAAPSPASSGEVHEPAVEPRPQPAASPAPYFEGHPVRDELRPHYEALGAQLFAAGVDAVIGRAAVGWLEKYGGQSLTAPATAHPYDVGSFEFRPEERAHVTAFLNHMHEQGASQADVETLLQTYGRMRRHLAVQQAAELEELDTRDMKQAERAMRAEWGEEYATNLRLVNRYLDALPAAEREAIETERLEDGTLLLNTPEGLKRLAILARGGGPEARTPPAEELRALRAMMRNPASEYWRGPDAERHQARYRDLLRSRYLWDTDETKPTVEPVAELARLRKLMADPNSAYWKGPEAEGHQARYRKLLAGD